MFVEDLNVFGFVLRVGNVAGIHGCSLHHSQSQEEGEGKEREGGGEDGSGEWKKLRTRCPVTSTNLIFLIVYTCLGFCKRFNEFIVLFID